MGIILEYINNSGILNNYHSFNYRIENDKLILNDEIIKPYQDMKVTEYNYLIKEK